MDILSRINDSLNRRLPPAVRVIFKINIAVFLIITLLRIFAPPLAEIFVDLLAEIPAYSLRRLQIWRFVTYMFTQVGFTHIFFNMLILWFFGPEIEYRLGTRRFWEFYMIVGVGAGILRSILGPLSGTEIGPVIGASGAITGVMLAYGAYYPNRMVLFWGIFPIRMKWLVAIIILGEIFVASGNPHDGVSHITHLAGVAVAFAYLSRYHRTTDITRWQYMR